MDDGAPAWYGKMASLGDFAHRRMAPGLRELCDGWLSRAMAGSREHLGPRWLDAYLTAPLWRFAWAPGIVDERWWFGVLMPSCDNVGRYFPLLVLQPRPAPPMDGAGVAHLQHWYGEMAEAALQTLEARTSVEEFEAALFDAPPWPTAHSLRARADATGYAMSRAARLDEVLGAIAAEQLMADFAERSVWWSGADAVLTFRGLPQDKDFVVLWA